MSLADPDLINNHGLRNAETARAALALIDALNSTGARQVDFDLTMNGLGARGAAPNLLQLAFEPPFLAMTLALFVAALLAGLHGAFRFGPARREERAIAFGKAALVENSAGLIRLAGARRGSAALMPTSSAQRGGARRRRAALAPGRGARRLSRPAVAARRARPSASLPRSSSAPRDRARPDGRGARPLPMEEGHHPVNVD